MNNQHRKKKPEFNIDLDGVIFHEGVLEIIPEGYFLRSSDYNYLSSLEMMCMYRPHK